MLRSMDSAVAGLRAHQNKMDVIGHNLANVNTFGFKAQTYTFKEAMYQTSSASTGGTNDAGGSNAAQYGYGTLMGTIGVDMTASTPSYVGGLNATINGEGFFLTSSKKYEGTAAGGGTGGTIDTTIKDKDVKEMGAEWDYTRVGQFSIDSKGYLVDGNGNFVYGFYPSDFKDGKLNEAAKLKPLRIHTGVDTTQTPPTLSFDTTGTVKASKATSVSINKLGEITATVTPDGADEAVAGLHIGTLAIVTFQNPEGLTKVGETYYNADTKDNTGRADATVPGTDAATLMAGYIEASNVDLAKEFADMIMTQRGFQANSKMITVSDEMLTELVNMKR